jgi:transposase-like protein
MTRHCPVCGEENEPMGVLGRLAHFCCRACGAWFSAEKEIE